MSNKVFITEKNVMTEILQSYREHPCLWDSTHLLYNNKEARRKALQELLKQYKKLYPDACLDSLLKKINNMRTSYKRERRKVLASIARGDDPCHMPTLWYFKLMSFLEGQFTDTAQSINQSTDCEDNEEEGSGLLKRRLQGTDHQNMIEEYIDGNEELEIQNYDSDVEDQPSAKKPSLTSVYITESEGKKQHLDKFLNDHVYTKKNSPQNSTNSIEESESFGRTVGLQLKQLDCFQRTVAEKLISEVIFYARLNKLSANSYLNLNADKYN